MIPLCLINIRDSTSPSCNLNTELKMHRRLVSFLYSAVFDMTQNCLLCLPMGWNFNTLPRAKIKIKSHPIHTGILTHYRLTPYQEALCPDGNATMQIVLQKINILDTATLFLKIQLHFKQLFIVFSDIIVAIIKPHFNFRK